MIPTAVTATTPAGPLTLLLVGDTVRASGFTGDASKLAARADLALPRPGSAPAAIRDALAAWLGGDADALAGLPAEQPGTPFQQAVWEALAAVPPGRTTSYAALAAAVGRPRAVRAAGAACGANLLAPLVPCHRAVRADGRTGGYAYGTAVKEWLLRHERD